MQGFTCRCHQRPQLPWHLTPVNNNSLYILDSHMQLTTCLGMLTATRGDEFRWEAYVPSRAGGGGSRGDKAWTILNNL